MSDKPDDGGPAFPYRCCEGPGQDKTYHFATGMSLRDWFAGMALQGIIAGSVSLGELDNGIRSVVDSEALASYMITDAMLAERDKKTGATDET